LALARAAMGQDIPSATLCYLWDSRYPAGTRGANPYSARLRYIVLTGSKTQPGQWQPQRRRIADDFATLFGTESATLHPVVAVAVGADSDNTQTTSVAYVTQLHWQKRIVQALKSCGVTMIQERATGITASEVLLSNGSRLACDVPILAFGAQIPAWLQGCGLNLDAQAQISVDLYQRAASHPQVFASSHANHRVNTALNDNLRAVLAGVKPHTAHPQTISLEFMACGGQHAIVRWGNYSLQGRWVGWLKARTDCALFQKYSWVTLP
jgi:hypothetical protein